MQRQRNCNGNGNGNGKNRNVAKRDKGGIRGIGLEEEFLGKHAEITEKIISAFYVVLNELGTGFVESVYRRALCIALVEAGLKVQEELPLEVWFHGKSVGIFKADVVVEGLVLLELKVAEEITRPFEAQLLHYLRATNVEVGMVLAFGTKAKFRRLNLDNEPKKGLHARRPANGGA